ncbi:restriction endonuclease subunit S [Bosea sp. Root483D1]|uniref:restriction endonuclease subunit S n=1 Tax=Bosea sp. Root483D1 TaxID=1736544 RepID=UPI0009E70459|nr:restriction endonuclease subunit S [Bosea sp. Root483D1]
MSNWKEVKLREVGHIVTGKTPPTSDADSYGGEILFVTPSDMDGRRNIEKTARTLTEKGVSKVQSSFIQKPSLVVSCIGSDMGKAALVNGPYVSNQQINSIIVSGRFDRFFVYYNLLARKDEIRSKASGAAQPIMNKTDFGNLPILVPDLPTQEAIGLVLGALDDKIELNRRMNETLEAIAQAIFKDWFVNFGPTRRRLAGTTDAVATMGGLTPDATRATELAALFPDTLGDDGLPVGWRLEPLLDLAYWVNGAAYKNMHFVASGEGLPVVKIAELKVGVTDQTKFTNTDLGGRYRIHNGELLFSWSGNPDTSIDAFIWTGNEAWLNQHIFAVRENGKRTKAALYIALKYLMPQFAELARNKQTTGLGHVTKDDMKRLLVPSPSEDILASFSNIIEPIFERIYSSLSENRALAETRDYLLPKLMSGDVRVHHAKKLAEGVPI